MDGHNLNTYMTRKCILNVEIVKSQIKLSCATCCTGNYLSNQITIVAISCMNVHLLPEHCHEGRHPRKLPEKGRSLPTGAAARARGENVLLSTARRRVSLRRARAVSSQWLPVTSTPTLAYTHLIQRQSALVFTSDLN